MNTKFWLLPENNNTDCVWEQDIDGNIWFIQDIYFSKTQQFITQNYAPGNVFRL